MHCSLSTEPSLCNMWLILFKAYNNNKLIIIFRFPSRHYCLTSTEANLAWRQTGSALVFISFCLPLPQSPTPAIILSPLPLTDKGCFTSCSLISDTGIYKTAMTCAKWASRVRRSSWGAQSHFCLCRGDERWLMRERWEESGSKFKRQSWVSVQSSLGWLRYSTWSCAKVHSYIFRLSKSEHKETIRISLHRVT